MSRRTDVAYQGEIADSIPLGIGVINANEHEDLVHPSRIELGRGINDCRWSRNSFGERFNFVRGYKAGRKGFGLRVRKGRGLTVVDGLS
jgi:hypothetical protein